MRSTSRRGYPPHLWPGSSAAGQLCYADRGYSGVLRDTRGHRVLRSQVELVGRAPHTGRALVQDVRVDLGRADVTVPEQLLDSADVLAGLQEVGGERMPERVARGPLRDPGAAHGVLDGTLQHRLVKMMAPPLVGRALHVDARRREHRLPPPLAPGLGILPAESPRQLDPARAPPEIALVLALDRVEMLGELGNHDRGQRGRSILAALAATHCDLVAREVDVLHTEAQGLEEAER